MTDCIGKLEYLKEPLWIPKPSGLIIYCSARIPPIPRQFQPLIRFFYTITTCWLRTTRSISSNSFLHVFRSTQRFVDYLIIEIQLVLMNCAISVVQEPLCMDGMPLCNARRAPCIQATRWCMSVVSTTLPAGQKWPAAVLLVARQQL